MWQIAILDGGSGSADVFASSLPEFCIVGCLFSNREESVPDAPGGPAQPPIRKSNLEFSLRHRRSFGLLLSFALVSLRYNCERGLHFPASCDRSQGPTKPELGVLSELRCQLFRSVDKVGLASATSPRESPISDDGQQEGIEASEGSSMRRWWLTVVMDPQIWRRGGFDLRRV